MERVIHLRGATVTLYDDRLIVKDGFQRNKTAWMFCICAWFFYAMVSVWRYFETGGDYLLYLGIGVAVFSLVNLRRWLRLHDKDEIRLDEVQEIKFNSSLLLGNTLDLKLNNGRHREINAVTPVVGELQRYFAERGL